MTLTIFALTYSLVAVFAWQFSSRLRADNLLLQRFAHLDPLTGVGNRRALDVRVAQLIAHRDEKCQPSCAMLMVDIDHFKKINDNHGHEVGDGALQKLVGYLHDHCDPQTEIYRFGGEEFCILTAKTLEEAHHLAEVLRQAVERGTQAEEHPLTISIGVALLQPGQSASDWFKSADEVLYRAKSGGRNCTHIT
ncbi:MAG: GGDEF domain-containing protein [Gammaproteobacteria bacterium]|nr:GGDEF domain-containing protein [Gammaproteobacteria bacterium]